MKARFACAVVLAALCSTVAAGVTEEHDRFSGKNRLTYTSDPANARLEKPSFSIRATPGDINAVTFMYTPGLGRYAIQKGQFSGCSRIEWLVDGKPLELGMVVHDVRRMDRLLIEFLNQQASTEQLAKIGGASSVEYRLCGTVEGSLTAEDIAGAKEIASRLSQ